MIMVQYPIPEIVSFSFRPFEQRFRLLSWYCCLLLFHSVRSYYHSSSTIFCYLPPPSLRGWRAKDGRSRTNMRLYYCCCLLLLWFRSVRSFYLHLLHLPRLFLVKFLLYILRGNRAKHGGSRTSPSELRCRVLLLSLLMVYFCFFVSILIQLPPWSWLLLLLCFHSVVRSFCYSAGF